MSECPREGKKCYEYHCGGNYHGFCSYDPSKVLTKRIRFFITKLVKKVVNKNEGKFKE